MLKFGAFGEETQRQVKWSSAYFPFHQCQQEFAQDLTATLLFE